MKKSVEAPDRPHAVLGRNIQKRRKAAGLKAPDFAEKIGMGISSLKDIERGAAEGRYDARVAIAKFFGCTLSDLYRDDSNPATIPDVRGAAGILSKFSSSPPDVQRVLLMIAYEDADRLIGAAPNVQRLAIELLEALES